MTVREEPAVGFLPTAQVTTPCHRLSSTALPTVFFFFSPPPGCFCALPLYFHTNNQLCQLCMQPSICMLYATLKKHFALFCRQFLLFRFRKPCSCTLTSCWVLNSECRGKWSRWRSRGQSLASRVESKAFSIQVPEVNRDTAEASVVLFDIRNVAEVNGYAPATEV